ncbi:hypothetical protein DY000_02021951 [Brassica cretica]|uniref:Uncharacterized protein n=1 Tax=Brassica cretica TaxID=69181 RepID=A0ABQ7E648_BRACR|nr:hypothetical protein DY000_02021951 [Brassica cretica]
MSQRLSLPCRLVKDDPSATVKVHRTRFMHMVKIRTHAGLSRWSTGWESMSVFGFFTTQAKSGSTIVFRMSRWSRKTSSGTVSSVVWSWFQPKLLSGRTRVDPVHCTVGLSGMVGMGEPQLNYSERPDLHTELVQCTDPWAGAHHYG